jgi:hypothetical protein
MAHKQPMMPPMLNLLAMAQHFATLQLGLCDFFFGDSNV